MAKAVEIRQFVLRKDLVYEMNRMRCNLRNVLFNSKLCSNGSGYIILKTLRQLWKKHLTCLKKINGVESNVQSQIQAAFCDIE